MVFEIAAAGVLVLLVVKELVNTMESARAQLVGRFLFVPLIPLLAVFVGAAVLRMISIIPG